MLTDFYVGPGLWSPLSSSSTHFSETSTFKPPQEPGRQTRSVQCGWVDSAPPVATGCKWLVSGCFEERQLQSLVSTAIGRFWKLHKFGIKVFCSAGRSASWESYGLGRHFLRNFIAQIDTSEENHRGMEKISSLWRLQSFLWIKHAALADLAAFGKEHFRMLASQNSPASTRKSRNESVSKTWRTPAHSLLGSPPAQPVVPPIFHDPFSPRPHWDASTPPGADSARCGSAWTLEEQRMSDSLSNSGYKVTTVAVAAVAHGFSTEHDCGPRQLDHIWQASDGVGILRWNTVVTPDCPQYEYIARQVQIQTAWLMKSPFSLKCFLQPVPLMHWESQLSSLFHYLLSWRHYSVSWQIRQPFASSQETCRPQRSSCPSQKHDGEETKRRWHILHEKTEDKSFSRHRFQFDPTPIRLLRAAPMPNMPNIWTDFCHWESGHLIVGFSSKKDLASCQLKHRRAWQATRQQASTSGMGLYIVYSLYIESRWLIYIQIIIL